MTDPPSRPEAPSPMPSEAASVRPVGGADAGSGGGVRAVSRHIGAPPEDDSPEIVVRTPDELVLLEVHQADSELAAASADPRGTALEPDRPTPRVADSPRSSSLGSSRPAGSLGGAPSVWARADADPLARLGRQRGWLHVATGLALLIGCATLLVSATPSIARSLTSGRSEPALRGVARAARLAGWARPPIEPPSAGSAEPGVGRGALPGFDPLRSSSRSPSVADQLAARDEAHRRAGAGGGASGASALRLGVIRELATVRDRPAADGHELGELKQGELVVVGSGPDGWALVAGTTGDHSVIGWMERDRVVLQ